MNIAIVKIINKSEKVINAPHVLTHKKLKKKPHMNDEQIYLSLFLPVDSRRCVTASYQRQILRRKISSKIQI